MGTQSGFGSILDRLIVGLANVSMAVAAMAALTMCLLVTGAVFVRYVFGFPVVWVPEIVGYLMVALVFLALGETMLAGAATSRSISSSADSRDALGTSSSCSP